MSATEIILGVIVLAQMGLIYGLTNRLLSQAGQSRMRASSVVGDASEVFRSQKQSSEPVEHPKRSVIERVKVGV